MSNDKSPVTVISERKEEELSAPESGILSASPVVVAHAFQQYREIQEALDAAMPEALVTIGKKKHRTKSYWRAIATAFSLSVTCLEEKHIRAEGKSTDWGWLCTYRAASPSGRMADGDGSCFSSEKRGRGQATVHNVRAHAHTRAFNRAVANLVGFGEVSAEEMEGSQTAGSSSQPAPDKLEPTGGDFFD